ncbi:MAG: hypothetical protein KGO02_25540 [Alphaproteobacteria bacterium]|nr:hypothetical protein [Alphaproteobacteria bacterium]
MRKSFACPAVVDLGSSLASGEFYDLLGPNVAGTPTMLPMVVGFIRPEHGTILALGTDALVDPPAAKPMMASLTDGLMI